MEIIYYDNQYLESLNELLYESFKVTKTGNKASSDIELIAVIDNKVVYDNNILFEEFELWCEKLNIIIKID